MRDKAMKKSLKKRARSVAVKAYPWNHNKDCTGYVIYEKGWLAGYRAAKKEFSKK